MVGLIGVLARLIDQSIHREIVLLIEILPCRETRFNNIRC